RLLRPDAIFETQLAGMHPSRSQEARQQHHREQTHPLLQGFPTDRSSTLSYTAVMVRSQEVRRRGAPTSELPRPAVGEVIALRASATAPHHGHLGRSAGARPLLTPLISFRPLRCSSLFLEPVAAMYRRRPGSRQPQAATADSGTPSAAPG